MVTRDVYGSGYIGELSQQFAAFIRPFVQQVRIVTLIDAYCLYNRARGAQLATAQDLLVACRQWPADLDLRLREYPSTLMVIQSVDFDDELVVGRALSKVEHIDAMSLAGSLKISVTLASETLLVCLFSQLTSAL